MYQVNYRETISMGADFDYLHKKQTGVSHETDCRISPRVGTPSSAASRLEWLTATSRARRERCVAPRRLAGGSGQYGRVIGHLEVLPEDSEVKHEFVNNLMGNAVPPECVRMPRGTL